MEAQRQTVLIVDDTPDNVDLVHRMLKKMYRTKVAVSGEKALEIARSDDPPDLILLDIMMPEMDGYEVCRRLKAERRTREIPIIFLTAMTLDEDEQKGLSLGAVDYITKPINAAILRARVRTQLQLKGALDLLKDQAKLLEHEVQERTKRLSLANRALERFVPREFLRALGKEDLLDARLGDHMYGEMTIVFSDIRAYTTHAEKMTPQEVFAFTNAYHNRMSPIIREHGGFVQQFQGDGVVSVFPRVAADGIAAAIAIQRKVAEYNEQRREKGRSPIAVGVGLHTGPLMVGIMGDAERWEPGIPSDTVNTASRMEGLTKRYGVSIVASEKTVEDLEDASRYRLRLLDKVRARGKARPLSVYEVFDADPAPLLQRKLEARELFDEGQRRYFARDFAAAVKCFTDVLMALPDDITTRHYLQRSSKCLLEGVPEDWDAVNPMR